VTETPEQRVARLEAELAQAKVDALQKDLAAAQAGVTEPAPSTASGDDRLRKQARAAVAGLAAEGLHAPMRTAPAGSGDRASTWLPDDGRPPPSRLAPAPRAVPWAVKLVVFPFRFWTLFALFMVSVAPLAVWIFVPIAGVFAVAGTFLVLTFLTLRRRHLRHELMKWGEVANVTDTQLLSAGTYYSGMTYQNVRLAQAQGWQVTRQWYSGPGYKTRVSYQVGSGSGSLIIRGLEYRDGVILADSRHPERALCVSSFPYDIEPDYTGNWASTLPKRVLASSILMSLIVLAWTAGGLLLFLHAVAVSGPTNT
jgi:hypothetical protein